MNHQLMISKTIDIKASPEQVWSVLTDPEQIKIYLFGAECQCDWTVGSEIIFQGEFQGHQYRDKGIIKALIPNQKLQYTYWSGFSGLEDSPENYSLVTYEIITKGHQTQLTVSQVGFAAEENQTHAALGWESVLQTIKVLLETTP